MTAKEILGALQKEPRLSPAMLSEKLKINSQIVRNVLVTLSELKLVQTPAKGIYEITRLGEQVLKRIL